MTRRMKLTIPSAAVALALSLAACGGTVGGGASATSGSGKLTVAGVSGVASDPFWISLECGAQQEAAKLGVKFLWSAGQTSDPTVEAQNLQTIELQQPNALIIAPFSATTFVTPVKALMSKGVPVDLMGGPQLAQPVFYQGYATTPTQGFTQLAQLVASQTHGSGSVLILGGIAGSVFVPTRVVPFTTALKQAAPKLNVMPTQYDGIDTTKAATIVSSELLANPDLKAVYAVSGPEAQGAIAAVQQRGDSGKVKVYAFDGTPQEVTAIKQGTLTATIAQAPLAQGADAVASVVAYLRSHKGSTAAVPAKGESVNVPGLVLTKANVSSSTSKSYEYVTTCPKA